MSNLLLSTLIMMGITFAIGFFVAAVIKIIANWADLFEFYHLHQEELARIKNAHKQHKTTSSPIRSLVTKNTHQKLIHRVNETISRLRTHKRVTA